MNTSVNFSFSVSPARTWMPKSYTKAGKNYLTFNYFFWKDELIFNFLDKSLNGVLMVPEDDSALVQQLKTAKKNEVFTTPLQNLRLERDFHKYDDEDLNGLFIKEISQVEKTTETNPLFSIAFTFKVLSISIESKGKGYKEGNDFLILKTEPFSLGIEGFSNITRIVFEFSIPVESGHLNREKYEKLFLRSEGKEFAMKIKGTRVGSPQRTKLVGSIDYDTLSFNQEKGTEEIKEAKFSNDSVPPDPKKINDNNLSNSRTLKTVLIVGGIVAGLVLIVVVFYYFWKRKK